MMYFIRAEESKSVVTTSLLGTHLVSGGSLWPAGKIRISNTMLPRLLKRTITWRVVVA